MKILAVNGSPRKEKGNTEQLLRPFLEGAREAGAEVDLVYLQGMKIKPCLGCFDCWLKTPGVCCQKDEMAGVLEKMRAADLMVLATPLYVCGMTAQMKTMLDRIMPLSLPFIELGDGHCTHPHRDEVAKSGFVLISNCGFFEMDNFDALVEHVKAIARIGRRKYLGAILRPQGEMLRFLEQMAPDKAKDIFGAAREAGRQVVTDGAISEEVQKRLSQDLLPLEVFVKAANTYFQAEMDRHQKTGQGPGR